MIATKTPTTRGEFAYVVDGELVRKSTATEYTFAARTTISKEGYSKPVVVVTLHKSRAAAQAGAKDNIWAARLGTSAQRKSRYESAASYKERASVPAPTVTVEVAEIVEVVKCATIGCKAAAEVTVTYSFPESREVAETDRTCRPCGESYARRPSLKATLA